MKKACFVLFILTLCSGQWLNAQISHGGSPAKLLLNKSQLLEQDVIVLSGFSNPDSLSIAAQITGNRHKSLKFAHKYPVNLSPNNAGSWYTAGNGQRVWKLHIKSEGAKSLNVIFSKFELPRGGILFVYNPDKSVIRGGFNHLNNKTDHVLPVMPVPGEEIIIEYQEPLTPDFDAQLEISSVNHDYIGVFGQLKVGDFGDAESCEIDVNCNENSEKAKRGVVKMIVDGSEVCTGALLNNTKRDGTNYVLSAAHSFAEARYRSNTTLFIFNYQCPFCSTPDIEGTKEQSVAGAAMKAYSPYGDGQNLDFALMELSVAPPAAYRPVYLGWDVRETIPSNTYCIHHPAGDVKKISIDNDSPLISTISIGDVAYYEKGHFLVEEWDEGATEPGSSGSPLFNAQDQVVGGLSAGLADCADPSIDYFFRLSMAWDAYPNITEQLKTWLDPANTGEKRIDAFEPDEVKSTVVISNINKDDAFEASVLNTEATGYQAGHNSFKMLQYAEKFTVDNLTQILGVYFVPYLGKSSGNNKIKINIWSGEDYPTEKLYERDLVVNQWLRNQRVDNSNFGTSGGFSTKLNYNDRQNYYPIDSRVIVNGSFFVGFQLSYNESDNKVDTFALYQTNFEEGERTNTAYFNDGLEWLPFSSYPVNPVNAALWIDVVGSYTDSLSQSGPDFAHKNYVIWPNPSNQNNLKFSVSDSITTETNITIYSSTGAMVFQTFIPSGVREFPIYLGSLNSGIYMVHLRANGRTEIQKLSFIRVE